ncbi:hypothetical protein Emag_004395 [Eimeria magna]
MAHATASAVTAAEASPQRGSELFSYFAVHTDTPCISGSVEAAMRGSLCGFLLGSVFAKMILGGTLGDPFRLGATKRDGEPFGGNKWLLLLAMRSQNFEAQKLVYEKILRQRQQLLQLPAGESAFAQAAVATKRDVPVPAKLKQQQQLLLRRQQLMLEQQQLLGEEQRLQREQQQLKRQHTTFRPVLCQRLRQMFLSSNIISGSTSDSRPTFFGEALRQQRLLLSSRPFASLQMGCWVGFRIGCLFCKLTARAKTEHTCSGSRRNNASSDYLPGFIVSHSSPHSLLAAVFMPSSISEFASGFTEHNLRGLLLRARLEIHTL